MTSGQDGCEDTRRRKFLLSHGFKPLATDPDILCAEKVRLADMAKRLGFSVADLRPVRNPPLDSDERSVKIGDLILLVCSEVRDESRHIVPRSLDRADAVCTIIVSLADSLPEPDPLPFKQPTDSAPRLHIESATLQQEPPKQLQITLELVGEGKAGIAALPTQFRGYLSRVGQPPIFLGENAIAFPRNTPSVILAAPGRPTVLKVSASVDVLTDGPDNTFAPGEYVLFIGLGARGDQEVNNGWTESEVYSNKYTFVVH